MACESLQVPLLHISTAQQFVGCRKSSTTAVDNTKPLHHQSSSFGLLLSPID